MPGFVGLRHAGPPTAQVPAVWPPGLTRERSPNRLFPMEGREVGGGMKRGRDFAVLVHPPAALHSMTQWAFLMPSSALDSMPNGREAMGARDPERVRKEDLAPR